MAGKTIKQRIVLEGGDEVKKVLEELGKAGEESLKQIQDAASETGPELKQVGEAAVEAGDGVSKLGEEGVKAAGALSAVGDAGEKATVNVADSGKAAEKSAVSYASLASGVVRAGAAVGAMAEGATTATAATAALGVQTVGAAAAVGTFALALGSTLVSAIAAAVTGLSLLAKLLEQVAFSDAKLANTLEHLATNAKATGQSFADLQVGQAAFERIGISAENFRSVIANIGKELASLDAGAAIQASADKVAAAATKVLEAERAMLEARPQGSLQASFDTRVRLLEVTRELESLKGDAAVSEKNLAKAQEENAKAQANNLADVVGLMQQIEAGQKNITFDSLTTAETKIDAVKVRLQDVAKAGGDVGQSLLKIIASLPKEDAFKVGAKFGLSETDVDRVRRYGVEVTKIDDLYAKIKAAGVLISPSDAKAFDDMAESVQRLDSSWTRLKQAMDSTIFSRLAATGASAFNNITASVVEFGASIVENFNKFGSQLGRTFGGIGEAIIAGLGVAGEAIEKFVTTPIANAWGWISETFASVMATLGLWIDQIIGKLKQMIGLRDQAAGTGGGEGGGGGGGSGFASGGRVGGWGTGTSDSNLAWVSRGEHIMPARAVSQPGVLAFLEALRRSGGNLSRVLDGMGHFALGGVVSAPSFAGGGGMSNVTIAFPGLPEITGLRASSGTVDELRKAAAMAQVRSGGRKPSRYS